MWRRVNATDRASIDALFASLPKERQDEITQVRRDKRFAAFAFGFSLFSLALSVWAICLP